MHQNRDSASQTADEADAANDMLTCIRESICRINDMNLQIAAAAEQSATEEIAHVHPISVISAMPWPVGPNSRSDSAL